MMQKKGRVYVLGVVIVLEMILRMTLCDKKCDAIMKHENVTGEFAHSIGSTDLVVCYDMIKIRCGEDYATSMLEKRPNIYYDGETHCNLVTILFFVKCPSSNSTTALWLVCNVSANDLRNGFQGQSGNEMVLYTKPENSEDAALHFIYVFCQRKTIEYPSCTLEDKNNINVTQFAKDNNLYGPPVALYFKIIAEWQLMGNSKNTRQEKSGVCRN